MLGYGRDSRSYRIYNPHNRRISESRNVTFIETPPRVLKNTDQAESDFADQDDDDADDTYRQDVLNHLPLLDTSSGVIETNEKDGQRPLPDYYHGSPSPLPSLGAEGTPNSLPTPHSGGTPSDNGSPLDDGATSDSGSPDDNAFQETLSDELTSTTVDAGHDEETRKRNGKIY